MGIERYQTRALFYAAAEVIAISMISLVGVAFSAYAFFVYIGLIAPPHWLTLI